MEPNQVCLLASQIKALGQNTHIFTLSTEALAYLLVSFELIEEQSSSFHIKPPDNFKAELLRDLQYLHKYVQETKTLKLYGNKREIPVDVSQFKKVTFCEFYKIDVNVVKGLQTLRPQLQKLVCQKSLNNLNDILVNCGGDKSHVYCWDELKEASFKSNNIVELDQSLECTPWLHTLDLSHNELSNIENLSCLSNLKYLNLSYNKLEVIPQLKGQICTRLQNLILKNNFIEDISGLRFLTNLCVLDLSNNCLVDHICLLSLANIATLQWLNLQNNPLNFHPNHRNRTASCLHVNTASTHFVLNNVALNKNEKRLVGSYYPLQSKNNSFANDSVNLSTDKVRRVRHVVIEEENATRENNVRITQMPQQYLETKKQIEDLHEKFGESWLNSQSGLLDVLGLEGSSMPLSVSPYQADFTIYSGDFTPYDPEKSVEVAQQAQVEDINEEYEKQDTPETTIDEVDVEDEESIYLATCKAETEPIFVVIGQTHLSERECSTGNEREKWHVDSILSCEIVEDGKTVQIDFETMRKDKKQRNYVFEEEIEAFVDCIKNKINSRSPKKVDDVRYQCMKCSSGFTLPKKSNILGETEIKCPNCGSTLVVEDE